jgi:hypothetical protein
MEEVELIKMIPHVVRSSIKKVCDFVSFLPCSAGGPRAVRRADANGAPSTPGRLGQKPSVFDLSATIINRRGAEFAETRNLP